MDAVNKVDELRNRLRSTPRETVSEIRQKLIDSGCIRDECLEDFKTETERLRRIEQAPKPSRQTHAFQPHPKYPWFCGLCGYPPHAELSHDQDSKKI